MSQADLLIRLYEVGAIYIPFSDDELRYEKLSNSPRSQNY